MNTLYSVLVSIDVLLAIGIIGEVALLEQFLDRRVLRLS